MPCASCLMGIPASANFCMHCGLKQNSLPLTRRFQDIDLIWLLGCLGSIGYKSEIEEGDEGSVLVSKHDQHPTLLVELRLSLGIVKIYTGFSSVSEIGMPHIAYLSAINRFNAISYLWTGWVDDDLGLRVNSHIALGTTMSESRFTDLVTHSIESLPLNIRESGLDRWLD